MAVVLCYLVPQSDTHMSSFRDTLEVVDIGFSGVSFTYDNQQQHETQCACTDESCQSIIFFGCCESSCTILLFFLNTHKYMYHILKIEMK